MDYTGTYEGTVHSFCDTYDYGPDKITFSVDKNGAISFPYNSDGVRSSGQVDASGKVSGVSEDINSQALGLTNIPMSGQVSPVGNGYHIHVYGSNSNSNTCVIDADLVLPVMSVDNGDGTHSITGTKNGVTLQSIGNDFMTGGGVRETFVFTPHFGQDEVTDFRLTGRDHDTIDLSNTQLHTLAQVLHHTASMSDGTAVINLNAHDSITLDGITKADLKAHPKDFAFA